MQRLQDEFREHHFFRLPQLLEPSLLEYFMRQIDEACFEPRSHGEIGNELWIREPRIALALNLLLSDPQMLSLVERVTESGHVGCFDGRVYRLLPEAGTYDSWHDDLGDGRLAAMSLNLSREPYSGGVLQIRRRTTQEKVAEVVNQVPGDAVVFRLHRDFQHRVTALAGNTARTAYAGWFFAQPDYDAVLSAAVHESVLSRA